MGFNVFQKNIMPKWEDRNNMDGKTLILQYDIRYDEDLEEFLYSVTLFWLKLVLLVIGESIPAAKYVKIL